MLPWMIAKKGAQQKNTTQNKYPTEKTNMAMENPSSIDDCPIKTY